MSFKRIVLFSYLWKLHYLNAKILIYFGLKNVSTKIWVEIDAVINGIGNGIGKLRSNSVTFTVMIPLGKEWFLHTDDILNMFSLAGKIPHNKATGQTQETEQLCHVNKFKRFYRSCGYE